jgi:hypothetical protein
VTYCDFNDADKFSPDADSQSVAKECLDWIISPLSFPVFLDTVNSLRSENEICLIRNRGEAYY